jgi:hypothetical protein
MQENKYRITLYDTVELKPFLTYDFPLLPNANIDFVEVEEGNTMFIIEKRCFKAEYDGGLIPVTLFGTLESGSVRSIIKMRRVKRRIAEILSDEPRPYPVFPETLD